MNTLLQVLGLVSAVADLLERGVADTKRIARLLELIGVLGREGETAHAEMAALHAQIRALAKSDGPVPEAIWEHWESRHNAAHNRLQALKDRGPQ